MADTPSDESRRRYAGFESVPIRISVRVGHARCSLVRISELAEGDMVALDQRVGDPFRLFAGEVHLGSVEPVAHDDRVAVKLVAVAEGDDGPRD